jgi:hypothetical protein
MVMVTLRVILTVILTSLIFQACRENKRQNESFTPLLKDCDQVDMIYYNHNDTLNYKTNDSLEIATLTELISKKNDNIGDSCKPSGQLIYKRKGEIIFNAEFSTANSNDSVACGYVTYSTMGEMYKHKLTYRAGMFIDDVLWHILKWSSLSDHGPIRLHGDTGNIKNDNPFQ